MNDEERCAVEDEAWHYFKARWPTQPFYNEVEYQATWPQRVEEAFRVAVRNVIEKAGA